MSSTYPYGGSIDYQLSIGPEIDQIMFDEAVYYSVAEMQDLANYVHSKGKLIAMNWGGTWLPAEACPFIDKFSVEFDWRNFINNRQNLIAQYPQKFIGISNDWGYQYYPPYGTVTLERAVADTREAWNGGVYYFESISGENTFLPDWWEQYLSQLPR
jgi:hypothetical protein